MRAADFAFLHPGLNQVTAPHTTSHRAAPRHPAPSRPAPHRTAPHRAAPRRTAPRRTAPLTTSRRAALYRAPRRATRRAHDRAANVAPLRQCATPRRTPPHLASLTNPRAAPRRASPRHHFAQHPATAYGAVPRTPATLTAPSTAPCAVHTRAVQRLGLPSRPLLRTSPR